MCVCVCTRVVVKLDPAAAPFTAVTQFDPVSNGHKRKNNRNIISLVRCTANICTSLEKVLVESPLCLWSGCIHAG